MKDRLETFIDRNKLKLLALGFFSIFATFSYSFFTNSHEFKNVYYPTLSIEVQELEKKVIAVKEDLKAFDIELKERLDLHSEIEEQRIYVDL